MNQTTHTTVPASLSTDAVADLLADRRRRHAVAVLADRGSAMALRSLARAVAERRSDPDDGGPPSTDALAVSLHHVHLPKLAAADALTYDPDAKVVVPRSVDVLAACIDATDDERGQQSDAASAD